MFIVCLARVFVNAWFINADGIPTGRYLFTSLYCSASLSKGQKLIAEYQNDCTRRVIIPTRSRRYKITNGVLHDPRPRLRLRLSITRKKTRLFSRSARRSLFREHRVRAGRGTNEKGGKKKERKKISETRSIYRTKRYVFINYDTYRARKRDREQQRWTESNAFRIYVFIYSFPFFFSPEREDSLEKVLEELEILFRERFESLSRESRARNAKTTDVFRLR